MLPRSDRSVADLFLGSRMDGSELREQMEAIKRWYRNDWIALDNKLRSQ